MVLVFNQIGASVISMEAGQSALQCGISSLGS